MIETFSPSAVKAPYLAGGAIRDLGRARVSDLPSMTPFHRWRGRSGKCYLASVRATESLEPAENAVFLFVSVDDGVRTICGSISFGSVDAGAVHRLRRAACAIGAHEAHVHLLAQTEAERASMVRDLMPLKRRAPVHSET